MRAKELGDYAELKFQLLSFKKGFIVSKPYGDNSRYDFIVDFDGILARVQVRATASKGGKGYRFSTVYGKNKGLDKSNIDYLAAYILSEDIWYIIPISIIKNSKTIRINPNSKNDKFIQYKDRWDFSKSNNRKMGYKKIGKIYEIKNGYQVRCGRKITKYFKKRSDAENFIDELNITPVRKRSTCSL